MSFDWAFNGCGGVFIDLQENNKMWSFSIHSVPNASFFSFHELRSYFFNRIFGRNWHHSFPTLKIVEINLFRWNFLLCSMVLMGPLQFALGPALCQFYGGHWAQSSCAGAPEVHWKTTGNQRSSSSSVFPFLNIFSVFLTRNILNWMVELSVSQVFVMLYNNLLFISFWYHKCLQRPTLTGNNRFK